VAELHRRASAEPGKNIAIDGAHTTMLGNPRALCVIAERLARA
jgi:hypothetical protein